MDNDDGSMTKFEVAPVPGYEDAICREFDILPLDCADGLDLMIDILEENDPSLRDRCGLIDDRFELFAIPLPDCDERRMVISIDRTDRGAQRTLHGTLPASSHTCTTGAQLAISQRALVNPSWEPET